MTRESGEPGATLSEEAKARQRRRNLAIGLAVAGLAALFYLITLFKMGPALFSRSL